jgi:NDP-sugar pyrophosphorylase family protein
VNERAGENRTAVILAGGRGTRLKPFTMSIPKPLLPVGEVPIIEVVIRQLAFAGIERIVITLGHLSHLFTAFFGAGERFGVAIEYCQEDEPLGTAGPLKLIQDLGDTVLVMNGDILTTLDFAAMMKAHKSGDAVATIAVSRRDVFVDYGVVRVDDDGCLAGIDEKPTLAYDVSMGVNVLSRAALEMIPTGIRFDMPDLLKSLLAAGKRVDCFRSDCYWQDIGRFDDYQQASADFTASPDRFLKQAL